MNRIGPGVLAITAILGTSLVAACGGGGSSSSTPSVTPSTSPSASPTAKASTSPSPSPSPSHSPSPSPSPSPTSSTATATGLVVDYAANTPLAGIKISLAAYTTGAASTQVATTNASGVFTFTSSPGTYLLTIGSNSASDTTTTMHTKITLVPGSNALKMSIPPVENGLTLTASQLSGNYRLTTLTGNNLDCFTGANQGRTNLGIPALVPDELETELMVAFVQELTASNPANPSPQIPNGIAFVSGLGVLEAAASAPDATTTGSGPGDICDTWTGPIFSYVSGNPPYPFATNPLNIWYGAYITTSFGAQAWTADPR